MSLYSDFPEESFAFDDIPRSFMNFERYSRKAIATLPIVPYNLYDIFLECIRDESKNKLSFNVLNLAMREIHTKYSAKGLLEANGLNYERIELRCGYVYLYCTSHARMVQAAFEDLFQRNQSFVLKLINSLITTDNELKLCSIGGGPGSDVVGAMLFLKQFGILERYPVKINLIDGYPEWASTFSTIMSNFNKHGLFPSINSAKVTFQDLLKGLSNFTKCVIRKAHVITMVKFVSAVCGDKKKAGKLLRNIFNTMTFGSIIMIIDNANGPGFYYAEKVAENCGLKAIVAPRIRFQFEVDEFLEPNIHFREFKKPAQRTGKVSIAFMEKTSDMSERGLKRLKEDESSGSRIKKRKLNASSSNFKTDDEDSGNNQVDESFKRYSPYRTPSKSSRLIEKSDNKCGKIVLSHTPCRHPKAENVNATPKKMFNLKPMKFTPRFQEHRRRCRETKRRHILKANRKFVIPRDRLPNNSQGFNFNLAGQYPSNFHFGPQPRDTLVQFGTGFTHF